MFKILNRDTNSTDTLEEKHEVLLAKSKVIAKNLALRNLPMPSEGSFSAYVAPIEGAYKNLLATYVKRTNQSNVLIELQKDTYFAKQNRLKEKLQQQTDQLRRSDLERQEVDGIKKDTSNNWIIHAAISLFAAFEASFTRKALSIFDASNNLAQIFILLGLTVLFIALPHLLVYVYRSTKHYKYRIIIWLGLAAIILSAFTVFGVLRTAYLENIELTTVENAKTRIVVSLKPIYFTLIQVLLLSVSTYLASLLPTGEERLVNKRDKGLIKRRKQLELDIERTESELNTIPDTIYRNELQKSNAESQAMALESQIRSMYQEALGAFVTENCLWRTDQARPTCFDEPYPQL